jgi:hypothetical protein
MWMPQDIDGDIDWINDIDIGRNNRPVVRSVPYGAAGHVRAGYKVPARLNRQRKLKRTTGVGK